jgi:hypothetical protein
LEGKYQRAIQRVQERQLENSGLLDKSGWAKMKSPKHLEVDSSFRVNKIGHTLIDRASFLRMSKEKVSTVRIHKPQQHA